VHTNSLVAGILTCSGHGSKDVVALGGNLGGAIGVVACVVVGERYELLAHPSESSALLYEQRKRTQHAATAAPRGLASSPQPGGAASGCDRALSCAEASARAGQCVHRFCMSAANYATLCTAPRGQVLARSGCKDTWRANWNTISPCRK
jgi:hypothetical protein